MKGNNSGSILIWSVFLVITITSSFLYISLQISKAIEKNKTTIEQHEELVAFDNIAFGEKKKITIGESQYVEYAYLDKYESTLGWQQIKTISVTANNTGTLSIISGGPIYYTVYSGSTLYSSGLCTTDITSVIPIVGNISLQNLGGFTRFSLDFESASGVVFPDNYYKRVKNIGGTDVLQSTTFMK